MCTAKNLVDIYLVYIFLSQCVDIFRAFFNKQSLFYLTCNKKTVFEGKTNFLFLQKQFVCPGNIPWRHFFIIRQ